MRNFQEKKMILLCLYEEMLPRCNLYMKTFSCFGQMVLLLNFKFLSSKQNRAPKIYSTNDEAKGWYYYSFTQTNQKR